MSNSVCWYCCHPFEGRGIGLPVFAGYTKKPSGEITAKDLKRTKFLGSTRCYAVEGVFCSIHCARAYQIEKKHMVMEGQYIETSNLLVELDQNVVRKEIFVKHEENSKEEGQWTILCSGQENTAQKKRQTPLPFETKKILIQTHLDPAKPRSRLKMFGGDLTIEEFRACNSTCPVPDQTRGPDSKSCPVPCPVPDVKTCPVNGVYSRAEDEPRGKHRQNIRVGMEFFGPKDIVEDVFVPQIDEPKKEEKEDSFQKNIELAVPKGFSSSETSKTKKRNTEEPVEEDFYVGMKGKIHPQKRSKHMKYKKRRNEKRETKGQCTSKNIASVQSRMSIGKGKSMPSFF